MRTQFLRLLAAFALLTTLTMVAQEQSNRKKETKEKGGGAALPILQEGFKLCEHDEAKTKPAWKANGPDKCTVVVDYQGTKHCKAQFTDGNRPLGDKAGETWIEGFSIPNVNQLNFKCMGEQKDEECHYRIRKVTCGKPNAHNPPEGPDEQPGPTTVNCPTTRERLTAQGKSCNITVSYSSTGKCTAEIMREGDSNPIGSAQGAAPLTTFQNETKLDHRCSGNGEGDCTFHVVQVECKK